MNIRLIIKCIFTVLLIQGIQLQAQHVCEMPPGLEYHADTEDKKGGSERVICFGNNLTSNPDRYKLQENFTPSNGQGIKTFRINFHSIQNSTQVGNKGNFENTPADLNFLNLVVSKVNDLFANISAPLNPQTCICGNNCTISDTRIRVELQGVHFDYSPSLYGSTSQSSLLNTLGQNKDKELNIFFNADNGGFPGGFATLPSYSNFNKDQLIVLSNYNQTYENGQNNLSWAALSLANNMYHEIGHTLGLLHTYSSTCCPETMSTSDFDYLDDFFGGTNSCPQLSMPTANWCNVGPDNTCSKNWMGAYTTQISREATPKQLGRVHRSTMLASTRKYFTPNTSYLPDHVVSSNEVWDFNIRMYGNIRIKSGATLRVRCNVKMPPGSKIIIEENGALIVDGGTITDIEDKTWQGIQVDGDYSKTQYPENGIFYHGRLITQDDAVIENAVLGIDAYGGGIVHAVNTQFLNNEIDAKFTFYTNKFPSNAGSLAGTPAPNVSYFTGCDFHTTKVLNTATGHPKQHIYLWYVDGIKVSRSSFKNTLTSLNADILNRGYGIYSDEASFSVKGTCNSIPQLGSPCTNYDQNEFDGLAYGVYATSGNPMHTADISYCLFNDNWRGVYINGMDHSTVSNSEFHINTPPGWIWTHHPWEFNYGIYLRDAVGFAIEYNDFDTQTEAHYGVYTIHTNIGNESSESIYNNKFTGINDAAVAHGRNDGLLYRCNEFFNTQGVSIAVVSYNGKIANPQGLCTTNTTPASNYFDHTPCGQSGDELYSSTIPFTYNAHASPSNYAPACYWNFNVNICNFAYASFGCPNTVNFYFDSDKLEKIGLDEAAHKIIRDDLIVKGKLIDNGNTNFLIDEITNQPNPTSLYNTLNNTSPYLSDDVLTHMLITPNALGEVEKTSILISNSSLTEGVLNTLNTLSTPFSEDNMNEIYGAQGPISERSQLEDEMLSMRRDLELMTSSIIRQYNDIGSDSEEGFVWQDKVINLLNSVSTSDMEGLHSNVQVKMAQMYMSKGDLSTADAILASFEENVNNNYQSSIMRMAIAQQQLGATIFDVTGSDLVALDTWSQDVDKKGHGNAAGILASINGEIFPEEFEVIDPDDAQGEGGELTNTSEEIEIFNLYPNPSNGIFTITYGGHVNGDETLKVYSLSGQLVDMFFLKEGSTQINLNHLVNGIYIVRYKDQLKKMVIQH